MRCTPNTPPATTAASSTPGIPLRNGHTGAAIQSAQEQLNRKGAQLTVDGHYGDRTQSAVRSFQKANGLTADGVIGSETWVRLYS